MPSTKRTISSQILRRLNSGDRSIGAKVHQLEIDQAVMQVLNSFLRPQFFETLQSGGTESEGFVLCTYDNVPVTTYKGVSKCSLPAIPVTLPKNAGVHRVYNSNDVITSSFIPATAGEMEYLDSQPILSTLFGQHAYKVRGGDLIFKEDLTALSPAIPSVSIELVVMDIGSFGDYDILPINADLETKVIETVIQMFATEPTVPQIIDPTSDTK